MKKVHLYVWNSRNYSRRPYIPLHTERLTKTAEDPYTRGSPQFCVFCGLRNISFADRFLKLPPTQKGLGYRAFYISHPKMRSLRRNTPYGVPMGTMPRRAPLRMMFTARVRRCVLGTVSRESEPVDRADQRHILGRNLKVEHLSVCLYPVRMHGLRQRITRSEEQTGYRAVRRTCRICPRSPQDVHLREPRRIRAGSSFDRDSELAASLHVLRLCISRMKFYLIYARGATSAVSRSASRWSGSKFDTPSARILPAR